MVMTIIALAGCASRGDGSTVEVDGKDYVPVDAVEGPYTIGNALASIGGVLMVPTVVALVAGVIIGAVSAEDGQDFWIRPTKVLFIISGFFLAVATALWCLAIASSVNG